MAPVKAEARPRSLSMTRPVPSSPSSRASSQVPEVAAPAGALAIWASSSRVAVGTPLHSPVPEPSGEAPASLVSMASMSMSAWLRTAMVPQDAPVIEQADSTRRRSASGTRREPVSFRAAWMRATVVSPRLGWRTEACRPRVERSWSAWTA